MSNKICVVVGVGSGLGFAIAHKFGIEGYQVAVLARNTKAIAKYTKNLSEDGINVKEFEIDISDSNSIVSVFEQIRQTLGNPEILIYNAFASTPGNPTDLTAEDLVQDFKVNVVGAIVAVKQVIPQMREQKKGTILFTGGGLALEPNPIVASLAMGKAAVRNLTFSLAKELEKDGIHVATVTINGLIEADSQFDPDKIAEVYWNLHFQLHTSWQREYIYG